MINAIVDAISEKLVDVFGCTVYTEPVPQGLKTKCFHIAAVTHPERAYIGRRKLRSNTFAVTYRPESHTESNAECLGVQSKIYDALEYIQLVDGPLRGTNISGNMVDGALVVTVSYNHFVITLVMEDPMEDLEINTQTGG